eukprot:CAMPEP_0178540978 /NCGR_PEP_ID=MMETSP0697-20121206/1304_1 /TAXON_ID=265572 /ORGANISM="Extubocellulus spinifer, Strain CCMP396" /LENGTH=1236 /DNA_ID=CAMNT_0020173329 /DNA_START=61 /DNA_END=3767 /DNA_ORIENTATION=+
MVRLRLRRSVRVLFMLGASTTIALILLLLALSFFNNSYECRPRIDRVCAYAPSWVSSWVEKRWSATETQRSVVLAFYMSCQSFVLHIAGLLFPPVDVTYGSRISRIFSSPSPMASRGSSGGGGTTTTTAPASSKRDDGSGLGHGLQHPAQDVLVDVTGDQSRRSRMGRACKPVVISSTTDGNNGDESVELVEALTSVPCDVEDINGDDETTCTSMTTDYDDAAVEVRPEGAIIETPVVPSWAVGGMNNMESNINQNEYEDPDVGMTIQVFPLDWIDDDNKYDSSHIQSMTSQYALGKVDGSVDHQRSLACVSPNYVSSDKVVEYQLVERIKTRLGLVDTHEYDYMYRPVLSLPESDFSPKDGSKEPEHGRGGDGGRSGKEEAPYHERYEWMDDRAFAGGSHGEVWHARRRCPSHYPDSDADPSTDDLKEGLNPCDDQRKLIMKRLKVEHGYDLLEAGLREVYFGELLSRSAGSSLLFTGYVDHFFREVPTLLRKASPSKHVELWIVFEDAGPSLRSYLYSPITSTTGDFVVYQHSSFWRRLRKEAVAAGRDRLSSALSIISGEQDKAPSTMNRQPPQQQYMGRRRSPKNQTVVVEGKALIKEVLKQILTSAAYLHRRGIIHRDIKPSNIMCTVERGMPMDAVGPHDQVVEGVDCRMGDFSSAVDEFTSSNMYASTKGPSAAEQTNEYAPPEALFGSSKAFDPVKPQSYDSWSIGVVALEMLLGTPNVFSVDQRTQALLTNKMQKQGASDEEIKRALYLAALSNFCIFVPTSSEHETRWPLQPGGPLASASMVKKKCDLHDFHSALRARDPLGLGFDSSSDQLLLLILGLLNWDPSQRLSASEALLHPYFLEDGIKPDNTSSILEADEHNALEPQALHPRVNMKTPTLEVTEFICPKCGKSFKDHNSCQQHARLRRHAQFCTFDRSRLPPCLNAHAMLPAHPTSGYCDIQGRRPTIEDFHTVHLHPNHQFLGVFDGHNGNLASKYAASLFYDQLVERISGIDEDIEKNKTAWKHEVQSEMTAAFEYLHNGILGAIARSPEGVMKSTGTTATVLFITNKAVILANVGDSRAIISNGVSAPTQLSIDHVASNKEEEERIESLGGFVSSVGGTPRVNGTLAVSRSLGDAHLASLLSRKPHVVAMSRDEIRQFCKTSEDARNRSTGSEDISSPCFMVIASDGLWDVMSNKEVSDMAVQVMNDFDMSHGISWEEGGAYQEAAQILTQEAYVRGSSDNIGVCV